MDAIEKVHLSELRTDSDVRALSDQELLNVHRRLHQLYGAARARGEATEYPWVNLHVWVVQEMQRRGMHHHPHDELDRETERLTKRDAPEWLARALDGAKDQVLVPAYVSVVGSATQKSDPNDLDVLVREDPERISRGMHESIYLLVRKLFDPEKRGLKLHMLYNAQGPHLADGQGYMPVYDLILRPRKPELVFKAAPAMPDWKKWLDQAPDGLMVDLGPGDAKPVGFIGMGFGPDADILADLDDPWPLAPESVAVLRANHVLEHLRDRTHVMLEVWRVLKPGGILIATVPAAGTRGDWANPEHESHWSADTFRFYTDPALFETIERRPPAPFELPYLAERDRGAGVADVDAVLRKPDAVVAKAEIKPPLAHVELPKPAMKFYTEFFTVDEAWAHWGKDHAPFAVENKLNGFRALVQKYGDKVDIFFEDSQEDRSAALPELVDELKRVPGEWIVDSNVGVVENGKVWPRIRLMTLTSAHPELPRGARVVVTAFDILYWSEAGGDVHEKPFRERRKILERFVREANTPALDISKQIIVHNLDEFSAAYRKLGWGGLSEGVVMKTLDAPYPLSPATSEWAKVKHEVELKAIVLDRKRNANGTWSFRGGLLPSEGMPWTNVVTFRGRKYLDMGFTYNAPFEAKPGDIITVQIEELIPNERGGKPVLDWLGAKPIDVDKERAEPYYVNQAVDLARRGGVWQEAEPVEKADDHTAGDGELSRHLHVEVRGDFDRLNDPDYLQRVAHSLLLSEKILDERWYTLEPQGVIGLVALLESHIAVHTWPELGRALWDIESCSPDADPDRWHKILAAEFDEVIEKSEGDQPKARPFFTVMGLLQPYMDKIMKYAPENPQRVVEAFCGAGEVVWHVRPLRGHVLADADPDIVRLHRIARSLTEGDYARLRKFNWVGDRDYYDRLWKAKPPKDRLEWFHRELYLRRFGKRGREARGFNELGQGQEFRWEPRVRAAQARLRDNVTIERADFRETLKKYDAPDTFFFLDPPWPSREEYRRTEGSGGYYKLDVPPVEEIAKAIKGLKGKAMLVIEGKGDQLKPLRDVGLREFKFAWRHRWSAANSKGPARVQPVTYVSIFTNYEPAKKAEVPAGGDDETRGEAARRNWEEHWQDAMPLSGRWLPFVLHAHWRGLSEEETKLDMAELLKTNHSVHFDLRLGTDRFNGWFGFTLFAGTTEENRDELRVFRLMHDPEHRLEATPKQFGPAAWLKVGVPEPLVVPPGGVGSTNRTWSKFFAIDRGRWRLGFARQHALELWLDGEHLKGRFMLQSADMGGERVWLFTRPADQRPYAATHALDDVIDDVRSSSQRWLVWPKDPSDLGKGMDLIDVSKIAKILKAEDERRYTLAVAYPANEVDAHGDFMTPEDLEQAAWGFLHKSRKIGLMHEPGTEGAGEVVESYIWRGPPWEINGERVEPGDWLLGVVWRPDVWELIKQGKLTGFSLQGWGRREPAKAP